MKKFLYIVILGAALSSCGGGGGGDDTPPTPKENRAPLKPTLTEPTNNLLCINNSVVFVWSAATDPDGDAVRYEVQIAKDSQFSQIANTVSSTSTNQTISLDKGTAYYWRVKAIDSKSLSSDYSSPFQFYTEGVGVTNHLPFSPSIVKPALNGTVQGSSVALEWSGSDVDTADTLTYDVFFGTANPPVTKIGDNMSAKTLNQNVNASTKYYWKVDVKDNHGGKTIGQVWNFTTD